MKVSRGDVVLLDFPFNAGTRSKVRPALVIQHDRENRRLHNTIVVMITSRTDRADKERTQFLIKLTSAPGKASGLLMDSAVNCTVVFTVPQERILRKLGALPLASMRQVNACLRASFGL